MNNIIELLAFHKSQFVSVDRTLEIYFCGCSNDCKGCHNYELKEKNNKNCKFVTAQEIINSLEDYIGVSKQVHILGGEPLEQPTQALRYFMCLLKQKGFKNIILFTGKSIEPQTINKHSYNGLFEYVDYVKTGKYDPEQPNTEKIKDKLTGIILSTLNQKIYKVQ